MRKIISKCMDLTVSFRNSYFKLLKCSFLLLRHTPADPYWVIEYDKSLPAFTAIGCVCVARSLKSKHWGRKKKDFLIFAGSEPSVAVIDPKFSMESDSSHGGCHNMLCRKEKQRLGDEIESLKKEKISRIYWLVEQTDIYIYTIYTIYYKILLIELLCIQVRDRFWVVLITGEHISRAYKH